jgi:hypothetical protein
MFGHITEPFGVANAFETVLEQADVNGSAVAMNFPLDQFAAAHKGPPAETYDFNLDEN